MIEPPFKDIEDARALAQAIVDTVREPLLVLDGDLRVLAVSRSYYLTFRVDRQDVLGRPLYALGDGQWQIPALRKRLEKIIPERAAVPSRKWLEFEGDVISSLFAQTEPAWKHRTARRSSGRMRPFRPTSGVRNRPTR